MPEQAPALPTDRTLHRLARLRAARHGVLSLYLNFDPSSGERRDIRAVAHDALAALSERPLTKALRLRLDAERDHVARVLANGFELHGRSVILFSCQPRELWDVFQLQVPVRPQARFADRASISQLAGILDEHERYGVVLLDKDRARILTVYLNQVEHQTGVFDKYPGRTAMGGWAQARYARHREAHLRRHVLHVVEAVDAEARRRPFDRLIVGGPDQARSALLSVLPRGLRTRVVGTFPGELFASDQEVIDQVHDLEEASERRAEEQLVADTIDAAKSGGLAVLGWEPALQALSEGRVHRLLLCEEARQRGSGCPLRHFAAVEQVAACPTCGLAVEAIEDLAEWSVATALDTDALVETVREGAARRLMAEGGIGALLRY